MLPPSNRSGSKRDSTTSAHQHGSRPSSGSRGDRHMRTRVMFAAAALIAVVGWFNARAGAQASIDQATVAAIKEEGLRRSDVSRLFHRFTDVIGARLTGSPAHVEAARWALDQFKAWGLTNPQLEPFEFGRGWSLEKLTVEMSAPRYMPLIGYAEAWSAPTSRMLTGTPLYVGDSTIDEID